MEITSSTATIKINEYLENITKEFKLTKNIIKISNISHSGDVPNNNIYLNLPHYYIFPIDENYCNYIRLSQDYELASLVQTLINNLAVILEAKDLSQMIIGEYNIITEFSKTELPNNYKNILCELDKSFITKLHNDLQQILIKETDFIVKILHQSSKLNCLKKYIKDNELHQYFLKHIELFDDDDDIYVNIFKVPANNLEKKIFIDKFDFLNKLNENTYNLIKYIPFKNNNLIYSGGSLYDIITNNKNTDDYIDIDIFALQGASKKDTLKYILDGLIRDKYNCYVTAIGDVYYIFIEGVPRMIQLIFTNYTNPQEIINNFDSSHVKSYYNGSKLLSSLECIKGLMQNTSYYYPNKLIREFKILHRGLSITLTNKKPNINFFTKNYDNNNNKQKEVTSNMDYNSLLSDPTVVNYLDKLKFKDIQDIDKLCKLYKFDKNSIIYVSKLLNDNIVDVIVNTNQYSKKNSCSIVKCVSGYKGSFQKCLDLTFTDEDFNKIITYWKTKFPRTAYYDLTMNHNINLFGKILQIMHFGNQFTTGYMFMLIKKDADSIKIHDNMKNIINKFSAYEQKNKLFVNKSTSNKNKKYLTHYDDSTSQYFQEAVNFMVKKSFLTFEDIVNLLKDNYIYKIKINMKEYKNYTKLDEPILIPCHLYVNYCCVDNIVEYRLKQV